jgi:hypothetical protein
MRRKRRYRQKELSYIETTTILYLEYKIEMGSSTTCTIAYSRRLSHSPIVGATALNHTVTQIRLLH